MADTLPIPKALARRLSEQAQRLGKTAVSVAVEAIEKALDYDAWLLKELDRADAEIERGELVEGEVVKRRAKAILRKHGGAKAA
jgi:predicted transcriptional regulator